jgi:hypothetical protein
VAKKPTKPKKLKRTPKPQAKPGPIRDPNDPVYTHRRRGSDMGWRMVGSRPVSALADQVMRECGLPLLK